jgi:hypothetical protein
MAQVLSWLGWLYSWAAQAVLLLAAEAELTEVDILAMNN